MRQLTHPNQGRYLSDTKEDAERRMGLLLSASNEGQIRSVFGAKAVDSFQVRPVECYETGDAKGIYFDD